MRSWGIDAAALGAPLARRRRINVFARTHVEECDQAAAVYISGAFLPESAGDHLDPLSAITDSVTSHGDFAITRNPSASVADPTILCYIRLPRHTLLQGVKVLTPKGEGVVLSTSDGAYIGAWG